MAHSLHYGHGIPVRRLPAILREMTGITITQSAITQDALKQAEGPLGAAYQEFREQVRELIPGDYTGTLVTDRFSSYEAEELAGVEQHKCLSHLIRNVVEVVESKTGRAKIFGSELKALPQNAHELWRQQRAGTVSRYADRAEQIEQDLTYLLRGVKK